MSTERWDFWGDNKQYGDLFFKRATGESEEMESSKALCQVLSKYYQKGMKVADIGCGGGHYLRSLRQRVDAQIDYTGIDATAYYIQRAQQAYPEIADRFHVGDIFNLPAGDGVFDIVVNNNVVLHLPPPPTKAFAELIRVSRKHVVIRTIFGERNYIVKEIRPQEEGYEKVTKQEVDLITSDPELTYFNYYNMYTESYIRASIQAVAPQVQIDIIKDDMWQPFDNRGLTTATGTHVVDKMQVSGNLLLDWRFIILTKP